MAAMGGEVPEDGIVGFTKRTISLPAAVASALLTPNTFTIVSYDVAEDGLHFIPSEKLVNSFAVDVIGLLGLRRTHGLIGDTLTGYQIHPKWEYTGEDFDSLPTGFSTAAGPWRGGRLQHRVQAAAAAAGGPAAASEVVALAPAPATAANAPGGVFLELVRPQANENGIMGLRASQVYGQLLPDGSGILTIEMTDRSHFYFGGPAGGGPHAYARGIRRQHMRDFMERMRAALHITTQNVEAQRTNAARQRRASLVAAAALQQRLQMNLPGVAEGVRAALIGPEGERNASNALKGMAKECGNPPCSIMGGQRRRRQKQKGPKRGTQSNPRPSRKYTRKLRPGHRTRRSRS